MKLGLFLVAVAGCGRIGFDGIGENGPQGLACNRPVRVTTGETGAYVAGIATQDRIGVAWLDDDGIASLTTAAFETDTVLSSPETFELLPGSGYTAVSLATNGSTIIAAGASNGATTLLQYDALTFQSVGNPLSSPVQINGAHAIVATGQSQTLYAFAGVDPAGDTRLAGVDAANQETTGTFSGFQDSHLGASLIGGRIALLEVSDDSAQCEALSIAVDFQDTGPVAAFGGPSCAQPMMVQAAGRSDFLLIHFDTTTQYVVQQISSVAGDTFTLGTETDLEAGSEPRATAATDGYWLAYHYSRHIKAQHLTFAGEPGAQLEVASRDDDTSYDVVTRNGESYVVWLANGLFVERLCEN